MGTLRNTDATYYLSNGDHGNYRYLSLSEIIDSFSATYVGRNKLCEAADMSDISSIKAFYQLQGLIRSKDLGIDFLDILMFAQIDDCYTLMSFA